MTDMKDLLKQRGRGEEADYFRRADDQLIEKMRQRARLTEVAQALAAKLRIDDAELLRRVADLDLDHETGAAILLAPLVQVAWAEGHVSEAERTVVLELAASELATNSIRHGGGRGTVAMWLERGAVVVEFIFGFPGIGQALVNGVSQSDLPVVQAVALFIAGAYVVLNLLADVFTILVSPRLRTAYTAK